MGRCVCCCCLFYLFIFWGVGVQGWREGGGGRGGLKVNFSTVSILCCLFVWRNYLLCDQSLINFHDKYLSLLSAGDCWLVFEFSVLREIFLTHPSLLVMLKTAGECMFCLVWNFHDKKIWVGSVLFLSRLPIICDPVALVYYFLVCRWTYWWRSQMQGDHCFSALHAKSWGCMESSVTWLKKFSSCRTSWPDWWN